MDTITRTVLYLEEYDFLPKEGLFSITEDLLRTYVEVYSMFSKGNGKFVYSYARKLAGLTMLKINKQRGGNYITIPEGLIYLISNPAWKNFIKVGMTIDLDDRLKSYQTYSPLMDYKVEKYTFVQDRRKEEKELLKLVPNYESEWLPISYKERLIELINLKHNCV